jgi:hypothetical protein
MEINDLRNTFQEDLNKVNLKISDLSSELERAAEYRTKLIGGLETLQILDPQEFPQQEIPQEETTETTGSEIQSEEPVGE